MPTRERPRDRGRRRGEWLLTNLLGEAREARLTRNLSQAQIGGALGLSGSQYGLIERGRHPSVSFVTVAEILGVLGLELGARAFPIGGGLRDAGQIALLARFRDRVADAFTWRTEVPMPIEGDLRAWDVGLLLPNLRIGVDAETRLRDVQAVDRRIVLKLRDSQFDRAILLVAGTKANRRALHEGGTALAGNFPIGTRTAMAALAEGRDPGGNCLVFL